MSPSTWMKSPLLIPWPAWPITTNLKHSKFENNPSMWKQSWSCCTYTVDFFTFYCASLRCWPVLYPWPISSHNSLKLSQDGFKSFTSVLSCLHNLAITIVAAKELGQVGQLCFLFWIPTHANARRPHAMNTLLPLSHTILPRGCRFSATTFVWCLLHAVNYCGSCSITHKWVSTTFLICTNTLQKVSTVKLLHPYIIFLSLQ